MTTTALPYWVMVRSRDMAEVAELVRAAADGDQAAWHGLVDRYNGLVWSVARSHRLSSVDASDVVQTTWLRLVEHLDRLQDPERVGAWLATTARRECLRTLRHSARNLPTEEVPEVVAESRVESALLIEERDRALWQAFGGLSERCQTLLRVLVADPPPSYDEVSAAMNMPIGSIGPTRARCLERLRALAEGEGVSTTDRSQDHD
jgi:RNA polymerase sigma factor (sigma-70 family)